MKLKLKRLTGRPTVGEELATIGLSLLTVVIFATVVTTVLEQVMERED